MIKLLKKVLKWYFKRSSETYVWMPSCMIPFIQNQK